MTRVEAIRGMVEALREAAPKVDHAVHAGPCVSCMPGDEGWCLVCVAWSSEPTTEET